MNKTPIFQVRSSANGKITAGDVGLSDSNKTELAELISRENGTHPKGLKLTDRMDTRLAELRYKEANPELPQGLKSYCKQWLKEHLYKRRTEVKSKYIDKGNANEEDGFTLMAVELGLGMVYKNEDYKENDFMTGTCDLDHAKTDTVFDNKASWSLDTFPMFEDVIPDKDYEWQIQGYMHLWKRSNGIVAYTLTDMPLDLLRHEIRYEEDDNAKQRKAVNYIYTEKAWKEAKSLLFPAADDYNFIEIPSKDRIKCFHFKYDPDKIALIEDRVKMCQQYINELWEKKQN